MKEAKKFNKEILAKIDKLVKEQEEEMNNCTEDSFDLCSLIEEEINDLECQLIIEVDGKRVKASYGV